MRKNNWLHKKNGGAFWGGILCACFIFLPLFRGIVLADTSSTSATVQATVGNYSYCGDGVVDSGEACDNGGNNGVCPKICSTSCSANSCGGSTSDSTAPVISGVSSAPTSTSAVITWTTDEAGTSVVEYGTSPLFGSTASVGGLLLSHSVTITGLTPGTQHYFRVKSSDSAGNQAVSGQYSFQTTGIAPPDTTAPVISSVTTTDIIPGSATISFVATDNIAVQSCSVLYDTDTPTPPFLETVSAVAGASNAFTAFISTSVSSTLYYVRISCADAAGNIGIANTSFISIPMISSGVTVTIISTSTTQTGATVNWSVESVVPKDIPICTIEYGTSSYLHTGSVNLLGDYIGTISGLTPNTSYLCRVICVDGWGGTGSALCPFRTLADTVSPPPVSSILANAGSGQVALSWVYGASVSDFLHYRVRYSTVGCPFLPTDGALLADVSPISTVTFPHTGLNNLTRYYYSVFVGDTSGNYSSGVCANALPHVSGEAGLCANGVDDDVDGAADCADADCFGVSGCVAPPQTEQCANGIDDDSDTLVDCSDSDCSTFAGCVSAEICTNGLDDDKDSAVDCADADCAAHSACKNGPQSFPACSDSIDNDGDGLIDSADPGCSSSEDTDEYTAPAVTVTSTLRLSAGDFSWFLAEHTIRTEMDSRGVIHILSGDQVSVEIPIALLATTTRSMRLVVGGAPFSFARADSIMRADFFLAPSNNASANVVVEYVDGTTDVVPFTIFAHGLARLSASGGSLDGARVFIYESDGVTLWNAGAFRQNNPVTLSDTNPFFGFVVPGDEYVMRVVHNGFAEKNILVRATSHILTKDIEIIELPKNITELPEYLAKLVAVELKEKTKEAFRMAKESIDNPDVEKVAEEVVAPTAAALSVAVILPSVSLGNILLPLLRYLFLQPLLYVGKRKRRNWGVVYNSLTKLPLDLVMIRLISLADNRVVQSRVTDKQGRYIFFVEPGAYKIEVVKAGFSFPSHLLSGKKADGVFLDVYHGESITVSSDGIITPNIPLDPVESKQKTPFRFRLESWVRVLQHVVSVVGIFSALIVAVITPTPTSFGFLFAHCALYAIFLRYALPKKPSGWGIAYEEGSQAPVPRAIARLFSREFNKLVATQITDSKGRYAFLAGPSEYYVTVEKDGYDHAVSEHIVLDEKSDQWVGKDIALKKAAPSADVPKSPPQPS